MAAQRCRICGKPIGYETNFFIEGEEYVHAVCLYKEIDGKTGNKQRGTGE